LGRFCRNGRYCVSYISVKSPKSSLRSPFGSILPKIASAAVANFGKIAQKLAALALWADLAENTSATAADFGKIAQKLASLALWDDFAPKSSKCS